MKEPKTKPTDEQVSTFLNLPENEKKRTDSYLLLELMKKVTGKEPVMWGSSIVGFGRYHYRYDSGHEGDAPLLGFSPRKQNFSLYLLPGLQSQEELLAELGKHKAGKGCLYINKLADVNVSVLERLMQHTVEMLQARYPEEVG
ncbi:DUF1801 domain-containing protein [Pontibacter qinzhouensis]|uniref:DUF1801 domain-containing protein n=1 Tax=Pontibacter qinzhouensis TaxID=2603253 RepID=A0A5C8KCU0_9BACT|nr:DUF1801 domain-containing protein [Pontibacter qinzhouensis]TXK51579.1 DUF1801 domain-containing protein [Pontibacter qinzhouensis]